MDRARACAAVLAAAALGAGCEKVIGADFTVNQTVECTHPGPFGPPSIRNAGGDGEFTVVVQSINAGDALDGGQEFNLIGYDLDGLCTNESQGPSCRSFAWANADPTDGLGGIDNKVGSLMYSSFAIFGAQPFSSEQQNDNYAAGTLAPVAAFRVRGWDMNSDDDQVDVDWYEPAAVEPPDGGGVADAGQTGSGLPLLASALGPGGDLEPDGGPAYPRSIYRDTNAYVSNYTVTAHLPQAVIFIVNTPLTVQDVLVSLHIAVGVGGGPTLDTGLIGARLSLRELFSRTPLVTRRFGLTNFCTDNPTYPRVKSFFCKYADILASGAVNPSANCDSISVALKVALAPIQLGPAVDQSFDTPCAPAVDPGNDT